MPNKQFECDALAVTPEAAANIKARCELMQMIIAVIEAKKLKPTEVAERCSIKQSRVNDLLRGRNAKFSLDALVKIAAGIGMRVLIKLEAT